MTTTIPSPTWGDARASYETVWAALEKLPEGSLTDEERDDVATAMAWLAEAANIDPTDTHVVGD